ANCDAQYEIRQLILEDYNRWDEFVLHHPSASPFHLIAWMKSIQGTFGFRPYYLMAVEGKEIQAVVPLFLVKNFLLGTVLISSPFAVYGGILANCRQAREALFEAVKRLGEELDVDYIELRNAYPEQCIGSPNVFRYVTFTQEVGLSAEGL